MPPDSKALSDLIGLVYEAVRVPDAWLEFLQRTAAFLSADKAALVAPANPGFPVARSINISTDFWKLYSEHYYREDLLASVAVSSLQVGEAAVAQQYVPWRTLEGTAYYNEFLRPAGIKGICTAVVAGPDTVNIHSPVILSFYRPPGMDDFEPDVANDFLQLLAPHVRRAIQMVCSIEDVSHTLRVREQVLEQISTGVAVTDLEGRLEFANPAGLAAMARAGIGQRDKVLRSKHRDVGDRLRAAIHRVGQRKVSAIEVKVAEGMETWLIGPLADGEKIFGKAASLNKALILTPSAACGDLLAGFSEQHGLTKAEERVLRGLANDNGEPRALAEQFAVSITTIRSQLSALYRKTGVSGQAALLRKLASVPTGCFPAVDGVLDDGTFRNGAGAR